MHFENFWNTTFVFPLSLICLKFRNTSLHFKSLKDETDHETTLKQDDYDSSLRTQIDSGDFMENFLVIHLSNPHISVSPFHRGRN